MIELKPYCKVPYPEKLYEGYCEKNGTIRANVSTSKVMGMMKCFIEKQKNDMFFILELPTAKCDEGRLPGLGPHTDVYRINRFRKEKALDILDTVGEFLIQDGINELFGFGVFESGDEMLFGRYNIMTVFSEDTESLGGIFKAFDIPKVSSLVTAYNTFDSDHPGECLRCVIEGMSAYDIPDKLKDAGMYLSERRDADGNTVCDITHDEIIGKILLIGISYYTKSSELIERKQLWGKVIEANSDSISVEQTNGEIFRLPPDLSSTRRAAPGNYTLHSTGEVVVNPNYLTTWNITRSS